MSESCYCTRCGTAVPAVVVDTVADDKTCRGCGADIATHSVSFSSTQTLVLPADVNADANVNIPAADEQTTVPNPDVDTLPAGVTAMMDAPCTADQQAGAVAPEIEIERLQGLVGARFAIESLIGVGGMGRVFRARDRALDRTVAIKVVSDDLTGHALWRGRLTVEARIIARLQHPNIVQVYEVMEVEGYPLLILEYIEGADLRQSLRRQRINVPDLLVLMIKICDAVAYAHARGVIHQDIKPANVMLTADGEPKVMDFGIAGLLEGEGIDVRAAAGSPAFMAPEQFAGADGDIRTDIYALGVTLYNCVSGHLPFVGRTPEELVEQITRAQAPVLEQRGAHAELSAICSKAMAASSEDRYATAGEMARDLERLLDGRRVSARRYSKPEQFWRAVARQKLASVGVLVAIALLFAGISVSARHIYAVSETTILAEQVDKIRNIAFTIATLLPASVPHPQAASASVVAGSRVSIRLDRAMRALKQFNPDIRDAYLVAPLKAGLTGARFEVIAAWHESELSKSPASSKPNAPLTPRGHDTWGPSTRVDNAQATTFMAAAMNKQITVQHEIDADLKGIASDWNQRLLGYAPISDDVGNVVSVIVIEVSSDAIAAAFQQIDEAFQLTLAFGGLLSLALVGVAGGALVLLWQQDP